jgi:sugar lactone lactonase YvrE
MNEITTLAGGGNAPFKDRGPASEAILEGPSGVAVDDEGNIYIAAFLAKRVFKITTDGILTVVAGTGEAASSGDGGPAARAPLNGPSAVAFAGGLLYIAEQLGDRIRVVDQSGRINTFAGTGRSPVVGNGQTEKIKDRVKAREAVIEQPAGLAVRDGEVYFTEFAGNRVRKVDRNGVVRFVAGTGQRASNGDGGPATKAALQGPTGLAFDRRGNLYVSEVFSARVRRIDTKGKITTIAGLGKPGQFEEGARSRRANLRWPHGLAVDAEGNLFIADFSASRIYVIDSDKLIHTFAGIGDGGTVKTGLASDVPVENPLGLAFDAKGDLLVTLFNQGSVLRINAEDRVKRIAGEFVREQKSTMHPTEAFLRGVSSVSSDDQGNVYIAEAFGNAIHKVTPKGEMLMVAGTGLASTGEDNRVATRSGVNHPAGVLPTADGVFIAEADGHRIRFIDSSNRISTIAGTGVPGFSGDGGPAAAASAAHPHGIMDFGSDVSNPVPFLLASGGGRAAARRGKKRAAKGRPVLAFVDTDNHRVRVIDEFGIISTLAGNGKPVSSGDGGPAKRAGLNRPEYLARDPDGNIYVSEAHKVRKIDKNGNISTYAGTGKRGFSGEGGPATRANLDSPYGLAMDGYDLYIADSWNNIVWKVNAKGIITRVAGNGKKASDGDGGPATKASLNAPVDLAVLKSSDGVYLLIGELEGARVRSMKIR